MGYQRRKTISGAVTYNPSPHQRFGWLVISAYLLSLPVAHPSDAPRRQLLRG